MLVSLHVHKGSARALCAVVVITSNLKTSVERMPSASRSTTTTAMEKGSGWLSRKEAVHDFFTTAGLLQQHDKPLLTRM